MLNNYKKIIRLCGSMVITTLVLLSYSTLKAENQSQAENNFHQKLDSYLRFMPSRGVSAMSGKLEIIEANSEYSYTFKAFDRLPVKFSLDNKYIGLKNTTNVELPAHLVGLSTDIETTLTLTFFNSDKTYLYVGVSPSFYSDDWDFPASSFRIPARSLFVYVPNAQWTFLCGVAVRPDFQSKVLPILGFIYKPNDKLTFNIIPDRPNISYVLNDRVTLFTEGGTSFDEFEVDKDNLRNVVLSYNEMHLGCGVKYKVNQFIQSSVQVGGIFNRALKYRESLGKVNIKDGLFTEFRVELKI